AVEIKSIIGVKQRGCSERAFFPKNFASFEFQAEHCPASCAIEMIAELDNAANSSGIFRREIRFLNPELSVFGNDSDRPATGAGGCDINVIVRGQRRGDVRSVNADRLGIMPEQFAGFRFDTDQAFLEKLNVLCAASKPKGNHR